MLALLKEQGINRKSVALHDFGEHSRRCDLQANRREASETDSDTTDGGCPKITDADVVLAGHGPAPQTAQMRHSR